MSMIKDENIVAARVNRLPFGGQSLLEQPQRSLHVGQPGVVLADLGDDVVVVPNSAGIVGGVRAWSLPRGPR